MPCKFLHCTGIWILVLAIALTACAPVSGVSLPTAIPMQATMPPTFTPTISTPTFTPTPAPALPEPRSISANQDWQSTYLFVRVGEEIEITATGLWSHDPALSHPYDAGGADQFDPEAVLSSAPIGSLLGRIGNNPPFVIGEHLVLTLTYGGELSLRMNDNPEQFADNTGELAVTSLVIRKPTLPVQLLVNERDGYRLTYPAEFNLVMQEHGLCFTHNEGLTEICQGAPAYLEIGNANGRTLDQITEAIIAEYWLNYPFDRMDLMVAGQEAVQLEHGRGFERLNKIVILHAGQVYIWTFGPWPDYAGREWETSFMGNLYNTIINSFEFLD